MEEISGSKRLIFALDVDGYDEAMKWVGKLRGSVLFYKIGKQLFTACGPKIVKDIISSGCKVFLDLKYHDIPNTVSSAAIEAAKLGVSIFTLHASGGRAMVEETCSKVRDYCNKNGKVPPLVAAVTVLTSLSAKDLLDIGVKASPEEQVLRLAGLAVSAGAGAIVCSPLEISPLRKSIGGDFKIITPGIRPAEGRKSDDQKRVMCAGDAISAGADFLVIGRPIKDSPDPLSVVKALAAEIESAEKLK